MRFMMMVKNDERAEAGVLPDEKLLSEMGAYNDELIKAGAMLAGEGLKPSSHGARVRITGNKTEVIDGPFAEAKELLGGYWVIQAKSKDDAIAWAKRVPFEDGQVELRPLYEPEDFPLDTAEPSARQTPEAQKPARKPGTKRYALLLKADKYTEAGVPANEQLLTEMGALMQELSQNGALLSGDGLKPSAAGARVFYSADKRTVVDGPFAEAKEIIAGFATIQAKTRAEAIDVARRMLEIHIRGTGGTEGVCEVRELAELEDFPVDPAEKPDGWRAHEQAFRDRH